MHQKRRSSPARVLQLQLRRSSKVHIVAPRSARPGDPALRLWKQRRIKRMEKSCQNQLRLEQRHSVTGCHQHPCVNEREQTSPTYLLPTQSRGPIENGWLAALTSPSNSLCPASHLSGLNSLARAHVFVERALEYGSTPTTVPFGTT